MKIDIHNYQLRLEHELRHLKASPISQHNKDIILRFLDESKLQGLSVGRLVRMSETMRCMAVIMNCELDAASIENLKDVVRQVDEREWSLWTKATYKKVLKKFYKWLRCTDDQYPPEVKWIKANPKKKDVPVLSSKDLLTQEEVQKAIDHSDHPRNKAFIAVLFESGCRIGELGGMCIKNITFDDHGAILAVNGKTGSRDVRIVNSSVILASWINCHPFRHDQNAAVWINIGSTNYREPSNYTCLASMIKHAFKKAGITKRCNPHLFRHSRATIMSQHMTEFQMKQYFGWTQGSDMPGTYVHLSGRDIDGTILKISGVEQKKDIVVEKKAISCPRCERLNSYDSIYCCKCAATLQVTQNQTLQENIQSEAKAILDLIQNNSELRRTLMNLANK